jgi:putative oxidoreductase
MVNHLSRFVDLPGRLAMAAIFVLSGVGKLSAVAAIQGYMEAFGLPAALFYPTVAFELGAGLLLAVGMWTSWVASALAGFCVITGLVFHANFSDQIQQIMFMKNLAMAGGLVLILGHGARGASLDQVFDARRTQRT